MRVLLQTETYARGKAANRGGRPAGIRREVSGCAPSSTLKPSRIIAIWCGNTVFASAYDYYEKSRGHILIHPETGELIGKMLLVLKEQGEDAAFDYVRALLREEKQCPTK